MALLALNSFAIVKDDNNFVSEATGNTYQQQCQLIKLQECHPCNVGMLLLYLKMVSAEMEP